MASVYVKQGKYWLRYWDLEKAGWRDKPTKFLAPADKQKAHLLKLEVSLLEAKHKSGRTGPGRKRGEWSKWVDDYLAFRYKFSAKTYQRYCSSWKMLSIYLSENKINAPCDWSYSDNQAYVDWKISLKKANGKHYSQNGARTDLTTLAMLMNEAKRRGYVDKQTVVKGQIPKEPVREKPALTDGDIKLIRATMKKWDKKPPTNWKIDFQNLSNMFEIALATGCRLSETAIPLNCIDFKQGTITFPHPKGGEHRAFTVPILGEDFKQWLQELAENRRKQGFSNTCEVNIELSRAFSRMCNHIELPEVTFHCTRVTFITRGHISGIPEVAMKRLVNHSNDLVHKIYQRFKVEDIFKMATEKALQIPSPYS